MVHARVDLLASLTNVRLGWKGPPGLLCRIVSNDDEDKRFTPSSPGHRGQAAAKLELAGVDDGDAGHDGDDSKDDVVGVGGSAAELGDGRGRNGRPLAEF